LEELINSQSGQQIGRDYRPRLFLYRIQPIVDKIGRNALDGFAGAAAKGVVLKAGGKASR
jgi:hypothetical protein